MNLKRFSKFILKSNEWTFGRLMGLYPPFLFFGTSIRFNNNFLEARIRQPLRWYFRNGHGTIFGGAILAVSDPFPAIMFSRRTPWALTWNKDHHVTFQKPGKSTLYAVVTIEPELLIKAHSKLEEDGRFIHTINWSFKDKNDEVIADVSSTVYMRNPKHERYKNRNVKEEKFS